jgi:hypothetical protein
MAGYAYNLGTSYQPGALAQTPVGYRRDPVTGQLISASSPSVAAMPPDVSGASLQMANQQMAKELTANAGIAAGMQALQLGMSFVPTAQDTRNKEKLAELERLEEAGKLGLSDAERAQYQRELMNPVRALARESRLATEAATASMGTGTSVANLTRAAREERRDVQNAAVQAGTIIGRANLEKADAQLRELEERTAYKSNQAADRLGLGMRSLSQVAPMVGQAAAAQVQPVELTPAQIRERFPELRGMTDDQLLAFQRRNLAMGQQDALNRVMTGSVPYNPGLPLSTGF